MNKVTFFLIVVFFLASCQSTKDAFTLKKKPSTDEFLVEKKNPLVLPPDYGELPMPQDNQVNENKDADENEFEVLIKNKSKSSATEKDIKPKSIEESILQKIE